MPIVADIPVDENAIENRGKLDEAIVAYHQGLSKGNINTYGDELLRRIRGMLEIRGDLLGGMQLINFRSRQRLLFISSFRSIARGIALYCDLLHKEGNNEKAIELLATWRTYIPQFLNGDNIHCINYVDIAGGFRNMEDYLECAKRIGATDEIAAFQSILDIEKEMLCLKETGPVASMYTDRVGGVYATLFTSEAKMEPIRTNKFKYSQLINLATLVNFILTEDMDGLIINPESDNVLIPRPSLLRYSLGFEKYANDERLSEAMFYIFRIE